MQNVLTGKSWSLPFTLTKLLTFLNIIWENKNKNQTNKKQHLGKEKETCSYGFHNRNKNIECY